MNAVELRLLLARSGMSQDELADAIGKDQRTVGRWCRGEIPICRCADIAIRVVLHHAENGCPRPEEEGPCALEGSAPHKEASR